VNIVLSQRLGFAKLFGASCLAGQIARLRSLWLLSRFRIVP
jgi:hypothetical protein